MRTRMMLVVLLLAGAAFSQPKTHEEIIVRTTYAKASFAAQIGMVWHAAKIDDGWPGLDDPLALGNEMNNQIRFDLSDFKTGKLSDIQLASMSALIEGPFSVLAIMAHRMPMGMTVRNVKKDYYIAYADAAWLKPLEPHIDLPGERKPAKQLTPRVKDLLESLSASNGKGWTRYVTYTVVASLRERTTSYRASFLFKGTGDAEQVLVLDFASSMAMGLFVKEPMYPSALVDTAFREIPFVQAWIVANQITGCKGGHEPEVCCDLVTNRCGLAAEDVQRSMDVPIDPDTRWLLTRRVH